MKRLFIALVNAHSVVVPVVAALTMTVASPIAGPSLRAMTMDEECRRKVVFDGGDAHCHEEGTNCVIACPKDT